MSSKISNYSRVQVLEILIAQDFDVQIVYILTMDIYSSSKISLRYIVNEGCVYLMPTWLQHYRVVWRPFFQIYQQRGNQVYVSRSGEANFIRTLFICLMCSQNLIYVEYARRGKKQFIALLYYIMVLETMSA
jgi:hypothetical protein